MQKNELLKPTLEVSDEQNLDKRDLPRDAGAAGMRHDDGTPESL